MKGLIIKDFQVIIKQLRFFLIAFVIAAISAGGAMLFITAFYGSILPTTAIAYDERSKWNDLAIMFPLRKSDIVISKYLLGYIGISFASALAILSNFFFTLILKKDSLAISIDIFLLTVASSLIILAINLFLNFKFGVEKSRLFLIFSLVLISFFYSNFLTAETFSFDLLSIIGNMTPVILFILAIVLNLFSIRLSVAVINNK